MPCFLDDIGDRVIRVQDEASDLEGCELGLDISCRLVVSDRMIPYVYATVISWAYSLGEKTDLCSTATPGMAHHERPSDAVNPLQSSADEPKASRHVDVAYAMTRRIPPLPKLQK